MYLALKADGNMLERAKLTISKRDLTLTSACLHVMAHDYVKGAAETIRSIISTLRLTA